MAIASNNPKLIPVLATCLIVLTIVLIPFRIIGTGFLPADDALRHAAKAVSGKAWDQILVLRDGINIDIHSGWHALLRVVYKAFNLNIYSLLIFSVVSLFVIFSLVPVMLLKRPEAWALSLIVMCVAQPYTAGRLLLGRPYLITMAVVVAIGCLWPHLAGKKPRYDIMASLAAGVAVATWTHGGWYFFIVPVSAFFLARQWLAGARIALTVAAGIIAGIVLTGHPVTFVTQNLRLVFFAFSDYRLPRMLVPEIQPFLGDNVLVIAIILMLMWRAIRGDHNKKAVDDPVFMMAFVSWVAGFVTKRFWLDIGTAAALLWMATEFEAVLMKRFQPASPKRLLSAAAISLVLFAAFTSDGMNRWSANRPVSCLNFKAPQNASWAPGPGGTVYSSEIGLFHVMFFQNPEAPWRYMLGFEPGIMPPEDLAIYKNIKLRSDMASFEPWIRKLRPEDRLVVLNPSGETPKLKELEWYNPGNNVWIGRLKK